MQRHACAEHGFEKPNKTRKKKNPYKIPISNENLREEGMTVN